MATEHTAEPTVALVTKLAPPATVSIATVAGYQVSELLLWATLIYTVIMIGHKIYQIYKEIREPECPLPSPTSNQYPTNYPGE
jgi:hypothetical protein